MAKDKKIPSTKDFREKPLIMLGDDYLDIDC